MNNGVYVEAYRDPWLLFVALDDPSGPGRRVGGILPCIATPLSLME